MEKLKERKRLLEEQRNQYELLQHRLSEGGTEEAHRQATNNLRSINMDLENVANRIEEVSQKLHQLEDKNDGTGNKKLFQM